MRALGPLRKSLRETDGDELKPAISSRRDVSPIIKSPAESVQDETFLLKVYPEPERFVSFSREGNGVRWFAQGRSIRKNVEELKVL